LSAVHTFCQSAKASGYWDKLNRINLFCGNQLTAALVPLKVGGGSATDTNVNFVSGDYTEATGITGNGTTKYLNTGLVPSASLTLNDTHVAAYVRSSSGTGCAVGAYANAGANQYNLYTPLGGTGDHTSGQYDFAGGRVSGFSAGPYGMLCGSRISSASHAIYRNGSSLASNATTGGALPAIAVFAFANNISGAASDFNNQALAGYSIGSGLSLSDVVAYTTHMETFQDALGRGVA
jgi:hypothetical protein